MFNSRFAFSSRSAWLRHALNQASELQRPLKFCGSPLDSAPLEHFHQIYSDESLVPSNNGFFGFWLCFSLVTGFSNLRLR